MLEVAQRAVGRPKGRQAGGFAVLGREFVEGGIRTGGMEFGGACGGETANRALWRAGGLWNCSAERCRAGRKVSCSVFCWRAGLAEYGWYQNGGVGRSGQDWETNLLGELVEGERVR